MPIRPTKKCVVSGQARKSTLEEGLGRMAAWVKQHGARSSQKFKNIEVD